MNNFPDELMRSLWVKTPPKKIQFVFNKVFDEKNKLGLFNLDFPKPYGEYVLLSRKHEYELFLKFNYAKYRASQVVRYNRRLHLTRAMCFKEIIAYHNMCLAYKWTHKLNLGVAPEELENEVLFALNRAIDKFDVDKSCRFSTFASKVILSEVYTNVRYTNKHIHNSLITSDKGVVATDGKDDYIEVLNIKYEHEVRRSDAYMDIKTMVFKNRKINKRERFVLVNLFGLNNKKPLPLWKVGEKLGISHERVRQIKNTGLDKIRCRFSQAVEEDAVITRF